jgi:general secretion pathway protein G
MFCGRALFEKITDRSIRGFTLIELVIIIVILGVIAGVAIPKYGAFTEQSRITATKEEMRLLKEAIIGDGRLVAGDQYVNRGFIGDVGFVPSRMEDLAAKPDSIPAYDKFSRIGWNGPYIDSAEQNYSRDAWGNAYVYDPIARTITSTSATPNIVTNF